MAVQPVGCAAALRCQAVFFFRFCTESAVESNAVLIGNGDNSRCSRLSGNKKAGTQMCTDSPQKDRFIPCGAGFTFM